ncbi:hypothetical protein B0T18DRAFT_431201 [Schizothecium vesticola]|uniref:Uncharacterized protein n=1 Tax=Schizothecium vesticola TaxID=314040 RepID=A0AA40ERA9_9PEZI|nr:hypothetical protein B0T18DRAFT_431201 [Schizothecium vesticola]
MKSFAFAAFGLLASFQLGAAAPAPEVDTGGSGLTVGGLNPDNSIPAATLTLNPNLPSNVVWPTAGLTPFPATCGMNPKCYTHTVRAPPKTGCPAPTDVMCPMYIKVTSVKVPCAQVPLPRCTDCCPTTKTKTLTASCTKGCQIPTETVTVQTGCKPTPLPTFIPTGILTLS